MNDKFKVVTVPTKHNTGLVLITQGVCAGELVKEEYYGMLNEVMGDTYVHLVGIGKNEIMPGDAVINLKTKEIYFYGEGDVYPYYERPIAFSTNYSLVYGKGTSYKIPTIHHSTYTDLIQQHNHSDGSMWLEVEMEQPKEPKRTDDIHLDSVLFNQWLEIKDEWFIKTFNDIVVVHEKPLKKEHPNNVASNYLRASGVKGSDARMVSRAFKSGIDYIKTQLPPDTEWYDNNKIKPPTGGEYNVVWKLNDGKYPVTSSMDWDAIKKVWTDPRCNDCERYDEVLYWKELPEPPKFIDEKIWKL